MSIPDNSLVNSKKQYVVLDGLRGIAALVIVLFHFLEIVIPDFTNNILAHGFLAVDFFFCLSGFVIAYSYDDRIHKLGWRTFAKKRLLRLHPLVILGTLLGVLGFVLTPYGNTSTQYSFGQIVLLTLTSAALLPYPVMEDRFFNLFGLNAPSWSLFWEYVANSIYALILVRVPRTFIAVLTGLSALLLCYVAQSSGHLLGGWNGETFWHGGARIAYSFLAGMCIFRFQLILKNQFSFYLIASLLVLAFFLPYQTQTNIWTEPLIVIFYFPLIVCLGIGHNHLSPLVTKTCQWLGTISYPLYMTHYSIMWMFGSYYSQNSPSGLSLVGLIIGLILIQILIAQLASRYFDQPIRKRFGHR